MIFRCFEGSRRVRLGAWSGNTNSKSKKPTKKSQVVEISDPEDDNLLERNAALASPAKGAESRKA